MLTDGPGRGRMSTIGWAEQAAEQAKQAEIAEEEAEAEAFAEAEALAMDDE